MDILLVLLRLVLVGVFAVAGAAKLFDLAGSRQAMADFGLPAGSPMGAAAVAGVLLPLIEVATAAALLLAATAWWGALAALLLLVVFISGIAYHMAHGHRPNCHCFGQLHSQPIGRATLLRNGALALVAGLLVAQGPQADAPDLLRWLTALPPLGYLWLAGFLLLLALVAGQSWVVVNLLRQNGRLLLRIEAVERRLGLDGQTVADGAAALGLAVGSPAPAFQTTDLDGVNHSLALLLARGNPLLLVFSSPGCAPCHALMPEVAAWQQTHADKLTVVLVNRGEATAIRALAAEHGLVDVLLQQDNEIGAPFLATGTPSAVLIDSTGLVRSPLAAGAPAVRDLVMQTTRPLDAWRARRLRQAPIPLDADRPASSPAGLEIGAVAPPIRLPDLTGAPVDLAQWRGQPTLLLFWNPGCGFCRRMLADVQAWEAQPGPGAPRLVLISTGSVEANRNQELQSPILLDDGFQTGFAFGARGTPSAVLLDAQGRIAGPVVVGASDVMALLQPAPSPRLSTQPEPVAA